MQCLTSEDMSAQIDFEQGIVRVKNEDGSARDLRCVGWVQRGGERGGDTYGYTCKQRYICVHTYIHIFVHIDA